MRIVTKKKMGSNCIACASFKRIISLMSVLICGLWNNEKNDYV